MSDDTERRDAWRNANTATTVTGDRIGGTPAREHEGEDIHLPDTVVLSENGQKARAGVSAYERARFGEGKSIEDALALARDAGLVIRLDDGTEGAPVVADIEAQEAEHPDIIVAAREHWEAIVVAEASPEPTDGNATEDVPVVETPDEAPVADEAPATEVPA